MPEQTLISSLEDARRLISIDYWVEPLFFAENEQGESAAENFHREYQITERFGPSLVHYSKIE